MEPMEPEPKKERKKERKRAKPSGREEEEEEEDWFDWKVEKRRKKNIKKRYKNNTEKRIGRRWTEVSDDERVNQRTQSGKDRTQTTKKKNRKMNVDVGSIRKKQQNQSNRKKKEKDSKRSRLGWAKKQIKKRDRWDEVEKDGNLMRD